MSEKKNRKEGWTQAEAKGGRMSELVYDKNGIPIYPGDLLRTFHFTGPRKRKWYLYHVAVQREGYMEAVPYKELALPPDGGRFWLRQEIVDQEQCEIVNGPSVRDGDKEYILFTERPRRKETM